MAQGASRLCFWMAGREIQKDVEAEAMGTSDTMAPLNMDGEVEISRNRDPEAPQQLGQV